MLTTICLIIQCMNVCTEVKYKEDGTYEIVSKKVLGAVKDCKDTKEKNSLPPLPPLPPLPSV